MIYDDIDKGFVFHNNVSNENKHHKFNIILRNGAEKVEDCFHVSFIFVK